MKRITTIFALLSIFMSTASFTANAASDIAVKNLTATRTWEVSAENKEFAPEGEKCKIDFDFELPTGNDVTSVSVRNWIASTMGIEGKASTDINSLIDSYVYYVKHRNEDGSNADMTDEVTVKKIYETSKLVTFEISGYEYFFGAAHGMPYCIGMTFRKSDGKPMSENLIKKGARLNTLLIAGLKKYFDVKTNSQLKEELFDSNLNKLKVPGSAPYVTKDGVVFQYSPYEIAPYAAGMPTAVISIAKITPFLTTEGKALLK